MDHLKHSASANGIAEHARFHSLVSNHHNQVTHTYKYYSYVITFLYSVIVLALIFWLSSVSSISAQKTEETAIAILLAIPIITIFVYCVDNLISRFFSKLRINENI